MKKILAGAAAAATIALGTTACGGAGYVNANYCVNQLTGQVMATQYCQVGSAYYQPGLYDYWVGNTYGHSYGVGTVIQHNYFVSGTKVNPSDSSARAKAGLPITGKVGNSSKIPTPAKPQNSPSRVGTSTGSKTTSKSGGSSFGTSTRSGGGFSSGRSSGGFGSSSRGGFSSGGRK